MWLRWHAGLSDGISVAEVCGRVVLISTVRSSLEDVMLKWALIFFIVALVAGGLGFSGVAGAAAGIAKVLAFIAIAIFVIFLALGVFGAKKILD